MSFKIFNCKIYISPLFPAMLACILYFDPSGFSLFGLIAIIAHEFGHLFVMFKLNCPPIEIVFQPAGIIIHANKSHLSYNNELWVNLAGCITNFVVFVLCLGLYKIFPLNTLVLVFGMTNAVIGTFNILPVSGLDGGDVLRHFLLRKLSQTTVKNCLSITTALCAALMILLGCYCFFCMKSSPAPALAGLYFLILLILHIRC